MHTHEVIVAIWFFSLRKVQVGKVRLWENSVVLAAQKQMEFYFLTDRRKEE